MDSRPLTDFAESIVEVIPEVARGFWKWEIKELTSGAITPPQFFIMIYLHKMGQARMTDIARYLFVTTAASTGIVERLVKGGYVERVYDPADRRIIKVKLTGKGLMMVKKTIGHKIDRIKEIFGKLSGTDREAYLRILTNIKDILAQEQ
ncbi:MAG: MarR family winged helix-turn-helix transcriptional regulator [Candidatus Omnitrophota bacterium]